MARTDQSVRRRRVFYIPGYDPFHPRRYRELYRKEGSVQAALSGYTLSIRPRPGQGPYGWHVTGEIEGARTETEVEVLVWSDIVKSSMSHGIGATYLQLLRTVWAYIGTGAIFPLMRLRKGPILAAFYPVVMLLAQLAVAVFGAGGLAIAVEAVAPQPLPAIVGLAVGYGILRLFKRQDHRLMAYYLMHDFAFTARGLGAYPPELEARLAAFRQSVEAALAADVDEVLVVGHSSGAHLAVSVLADLLRDAPAPGQRRAALGLLSLGHAVPMASFLPRAHRLRRDLRFLSAREEITWIDVTAPGDGCTFALCDPVSVSGVAPSDKRWPLVVSCAFTKTLRPETWAKLRWRFFRLHFQYLCAFDNLGPSTDAYDYFRITAGPQTLAARYAGRAPSKSRIETPANRYATLTA